MIRNPDGWLFEDNPSENKIHYIDEMEVFQLLQIALDDAVWGQNVKREVQYTDAHPEIKTGYCLETMRLMNIAGTVIRYPFGLSAITFPARRHLFRGERAIYPRSVPTLNRMLFGKSEIEKEMWKCLADLRIYQFMKFIWKINVVPYWEAKLSDLNLKALAQHYGFDTHLLDLTNDVRTALFFATCTYDNSIKRYRPLREDDCKEDYKKYGVIYHTPDWTIDYLQGGVSKLFRRFSNLDNQELKIDNGDCDGIAFQIGMQPLMRCQFQSGYIYPMGNDDTLQSDINFEKIRFKQSEHLSNTIFEMMDGGKKVFPNEGITEAQSIIEKMKESYLFSEDDIDCVYELENVDRDRYPNRESLKNALCSFDFCGRKISIQKDEVDYGITDQLLESINSKYDNRDLLAPTGGMFHRTGEEERYREQRCIQI